jgi:hypothetical protein
VNAAEEKSKHGVFQQSYLSVLLRKARSFDFSRGEELEGRSGSSGRDGARTEPTEL